MVERVPSMFCSCFSRRFLRFKCWRAAGEGEERREGEGEERKGGGEGEGGERQDGEGKKGKGKEGEGKEGGGEGEEE